MKTADEMFRELGYIMTADDRWCITYKKPHGPHNFRIDVYKKERVVRFTFDGLDIVADFEEIQAVAKLLEEMEEEHEAD